MGCFELQRNMAGARLLGRCFFALCSVLLNRELCAVQCSAPLTQPGVLCLCPASLSVDSLWDKRTLHVPVSSALLM
jgi:hypothetical protein